MPVKKIRGGATRFDRDSARRYWKDHDRISMMLDFARDPDGLGVARYSRRATLAQTSTMPISTTRSAVGTSAPPRSPRPGFARPTLGYRTTGIDVQETLIEWNRNRYPDINFEAPPSFELVSSVMVLQHLPFANQAQAVSRNRETLVTGGHALVLENVHYQGLHVFSNSVAGWEQLFALAGLTLLIARNYDSAQPYRRCMLQCYSE